MYRALLLTAVAEKFLMHLTRVEDLMHGSNCTVLLLTMSLLHRKAHLYNSSRAWEGMRMLTSRALLLPA